MREYQLDPPTAGGFEGKVLDAAAIFKLFFKKYAIQNILV